MTSCLNKPVCVCLAVISSIAFSHRIFKDKTIVTKYFAWKYQTMLHFLCSCSYLFKLLLSSQFYWHVRLKSTAYFFWPTLYFCVEWNIKTRLDQTVTALAVCLHLLLNDVRPPFRNLENLAFELLLYLVDKGCLTIRMGVSGWVFLLVPAHPGSPRHKKTNPFNGPFPGLPWWAGTRKVKPIWILLKQETVSGSGISWAICKSAPPSRQITTPIPHYSVFYRPDALPAAQPTASRHWRHR